MKAPYVAPEEALSLIKSNHRIFIHGSACTPNFLVSKLAERASELKNVEVVSITLGGEVEIAKPRYEGSFYIKSLFVSAAVREAVNSNRGDYVPIFLSEIPILFRKKILPLDGAIVQVSPPDKHGYCSLGTSVDIACSAVETAKYIIAQVNPQVPRTFGDSSLHISKIDKMVWHDTPLVEVDYSEKIGEAERLVGKHVAELIEDRSTLQMGIGAIPDVVLKNLGNHKDLGVHTEMFSNGIMDLMQKGVITNKYKAVFENKILSSFSIGSRKLYDFIDDNPAFMFIRVEDVNKPAIIKKNPRVVAINSAIEIDMTGQVCSDSIGPYQYSGIGGQMDFMRGAALSEGGKPIIAITSRTKKGVPRIVPCLKNNAGVVTTRGHVQYVVTEYGVAYLYGKGMRERAKALIEIAHPDDREDLDRYAFERFK